jgi:hypothetical protein
MSKRKLDMIFEIYGYDLNKVIESAYLICYSSINNSALIQSEIIPDVEILNRFEDSELKELLKLPFWKQPCINC